MKTIKKIKIGFLIDTIESPTAGTEKQLLLLIRSLDKSLFTPYLFVLRSSKWLKENFSDAEIFEINFTSFRKIHCYLSVLKFAQLLNSLKIDILQTHFHESNILGLIAGNTAGVRSIFIAQRNQGYWFKRNSKFYHRLICLAANKIISNSYDTKNWILKNFNISSEKVYVIHNAVQTELYKPKNKKERLLFLNSLGFPDNSIVIGVVANLRPVKSLDVFIKASKIVASKVPEARFLIVGDGPELVKLKNLSLSMNLSHKIKFLGSRSDIPDILGGIDIGVLTSRSESFSNSIIEYMASGLAVVCTNVGGSKEAIQDSKNGFLFNSEDQISLAHKIIELIDSKSYQSVGNQNIIDVKSQFSANIIINKYQNFYIDAVGKLRK